MSKNITRKIISAHLLAGEMTAGSEIAIRIDQTLTQDSTGTMAYLQFEAMGIDRAKTKRSVAYIDHNMLQAGFENADDHRYIQTVAKAHGIYCSKPGNGICHQVHLERFGAPGANIGDHVALFEATHGTAPKYTGLDRVNPGSLILSAVMMLEYMGWQEAADVVVRAIAATIKQKKVTYDLARMMEGAHELSTSGFAEAIVANME